MKKAIEADNKLRKSINDDINDIIKKLNLFDLRMADRKMKIAKILLKI